MATIKTSVNLTSDAVDDLKEMAARTGSSMAEVLRRAISNEKFFQDTVVQGGKVLIQDKDRSVKEVLIRR